MLRAEFEMYKDCSTPETHYKQYDEWDARAKSDDPVVQLKDFIQVHLTFHLHKKDEVFVAYMELRNLNDENFAVIEGLQRRYELILECILVLGAKADVFQISDARVTTLALIGMLKEVGTWHRPDGRLSSAEITNIYQDMVAHILGVHSYLMLAHTKVPFDLALAIGVQPKAFILKGVS